MGGSWREEARCCGVVVVFVGGGDLPGEVILAFPECKCALYLKIAGNV